MTPCSSEDCRESIWSERTGCVRVAHPSIATCDIIYIGSSSIIPSQLSMGTPFHAVRLIALWCELSRVVYHLFSMRYKGGYSSSTEAEPLRYAGQSPQLHWTSWPSCVALTGRIRTPMAITCLRLFTFRPELFLSFPSLYSCMTLLTFSSVLDSALSLHPVTHYREIVP
jgi:hypothetical protein